MKKSIMLLAAAIAGQILAGSKTPVCTAFFDSKAIVSAGSGVIDSVLAAMPAAMAAEKGEIITAIGAAKGQLATQGVNIEECDWCLYTFVADKDDLLGSIEGYNIVKFKNTRAPAAVAACVLKKTPCKVEGLDVYTMPGLDNMIAAAVYQDMLIYVLSANPQATLGEFIRSKPENIKPPKLPYGCAARVVCPEVGPYVKAVGNLATNGQFEGKVRVWAAAAGNGAVINSLFNIGKAQADIYLYGSSSLVAEVSLEFGTETDAKFVWHLLSAASEAESYLKSAICIAAYKEIDNLTWHNPEATTEILSSLHKLLACYDKVLIPTIDGCKVKARIKIPLADQIPAAIELAGKIKAADEAHERQRLQQQ